MIEAAVLVDRVAERLHAGCPECGGSGTVTQETGTPGAVERLACTSQELLRQAVRDTFTETRAQGWSIVRYEPIRPTWVERHERVAEEWSP